MSTFDTSTGGTAVIDREQVVDETVDDGSGSGDFEGWYCIATDPWPCPNCGWMAHHMTAAHLVIVWPEKDDPKILHHAKRCQEVGRNPRIVEYETAFGPCVSYYELQAHGFPVHGVRDT